MLRLLANQAALVASSMATDARHRRRERKFIGPTLHVSDKLVYAEPFPYPH